MKVPRTRDLGDQTPKLLEKLSVQDVTLGSLGSRHLHYLVLGPFGRRTGSLVHTMDT